MTARRMSLTRLLETVRPGSQDPPWTWADEHADLWVREPGAMAELAEDIRAHGLREPVTVGDDGRLWDGHHRVCALIHLGRYWVRWRRWDDLDDVEAQVDALLAACEDAERRGGR